MNRLDGEYGLNYDVLRDCLCAQIVHQTRFHVSKGTKTKKQSRRQKTQSPLTPVTAGDDDAAELADFVDYLSCELFGSFPPELRNISFPAIKSDETLSQRYSDPLPPSTTNALVANVPSTVTESLEVYHLIAPGTEKNFLVPIVQNYINVAISPPTTHDPCARATACEICERDWVPLTYHHLIPREAHAKAIKRGWHQEWELQSVAWLCRACHSFVHKLETNEELAQHWWSIERLMNREDIQRWAHWVGRVRWKAR